MQQMSQVQGEVNSRKASENQLEIVIDDNSLFIYEFEHYRAFTIYFPHNNFDQMIDQYNVINYKKNNKHYSRKFAKKHIVHTRKKSSIFNQMYALNSYHESVFQPKGKGTNLPSNDSPTKTKKGKEPLF